MMDIFKQYQELGNGDDREEKRLVIERYLENFFSKAFSQIDEMSIRVFIRESSTRTNFLNITLSRTLTCHMETFAMAHTHDAVAEFTKDGKFCNFADGSIYDNSMWRFCKGIQDEKWRDR